mgnify:CR=1 FL=1
MTIVCPKAHIWASIHKRLEDFAAQNVCAPPQPPIPLVLAGWAFSNDHQKLQRWRETVEWAERNSCLDIVGSIPPDEYYYASPVTVYEVGPAGGPMYLPWSFESKPRLAENDKALLLERLKSNWEEIAGASLSRVTAPKHLTGKNRIRPGEPGT